MDKEHTEKGLKVAQKPQRCDVLAFFSLTFGLTYFPSSTLSKAIISMNLPSFSAPGEALIQPVHI